MIYVKIKHSRSIFIIPSGILTLANRSRVVGNCPVYNCVNWSGEKDRGSDKVREVERRRQTVRLQHNYKIDIARRRRSHELRKFNI